MHSFVLREISPFNINGSISDILITQLNSLPSYPNTYCANHCYLNELTPSPLYGWSLQLGLANTYVWTPNLQNYANLPQNLWRLTRTNYPNTNPPLFIIDKNDGSGRTLRDLWGNLGSYHSTQGLVYENSTIGSNEWSFNAPFTENSTTYYSLRSWPVGNCLTGNLIGTIASLASSCTYPHLRIQLWQLNQVHFTPLPTICMYTCTSKIKKQKQKKYKNQITAPTPRPTFSPQSQPTLSPLLDKNLNSSNSNIASILLGLFGGILLLSVICCVVIIWHKNKKNPSNNQHVTTTINTAGNIQQQQQQDANNVRLGNNIEMGTTNGAINEEIINKNEYMIPSAPIINEDIQDNTLQQENGENGELRQDTIVYENEGDDNELNTFLNNIELNIFKNKLNTYGYHTLNDLMWLKKDDINELSIKIGMNDAQQRRFRNNIVDYDKYKY